MALTPTNSTVDFEKITIEDEALGFILNQIQENIDKCIRALNVVVRNLDIDAILEAEELAREAAATADTALADALAALAAISALTTQIDAATAAAAAATAAVATLTTTVATLQATVTAFSDAIAANTAHRNTVSGNPHSVTKSDVGLSNVPNTDFTTPVTKNTTLVNRFPTTAPPDNTIPVANALGSFVYKNVDAATTPQITFHYVDYDDATGELVERYSEDGETYRIDVLIEYQPGFIQDEFEYADDGELIYIG